MSHNSTSPRVSIIIVVWNSAAYLPRCLDTLSAQTYQDFEVIVVDNGSTDNAALGLEQKYPVLRLRVERFEANRGFAVANNHGARLALGQWLALLNSDAFPEPDWLEEFIKAAGNNPEFSFFACRQLQANLPRLLDGAGDALHVSGLAWRRYAGFPADRFGLNSEEVFSPCAAAALYSRQAFLQVGGFDEDFFSYFEDVDLGFRLRLKGFKCLFVPSAVVKHIGSASSGKRSAFSIYHGHRNMVWAYFKNMPAPLFWLYLPLHLLINLYSILYFTMNGHGQAIWSAKWDALRGLDLMLRKRKEIQRRPRLPAMDLYRHLERDWFALVKVRLQRRRVLEER